MNDKNKELFVEILKEIKDYNIHSWMCDEYFRHNLKIEFAEYDGGIYLRATAGSLGKTKLLGEIAISTEFTNDKEAIEERMQNFRESIRYITRKDLPKCENLKTDKTDSSGNLEIYNLRTLDESEEDGIDEKLLDEFGVPSDNDDEDNYASNYDDYDEQLDDCYDDYDEDNDYYDEEDDWQ